MLDDQVLKDICELGASPWSWGEGGNCKWAAERLGKSGDARALEPLRNAISYWGHDSTVVGACESAINKIEAAQKAKEQPAPAQPVKPQSSISPSGSQNIATTTENILWQAVTGEKTRSEAKTAIAKVVSGNGLTAEQNEESAGALVRWAMMAAAGLQIPSKRLFNAPSDEEMRELAKIAKQRDIEVFIPAAHMPRQSFAKVRKALEERFGDRLRSYQKISDLQGMIKSPSNSIVMTLELTARQAEEISKMDPAFSEARFMNFENFDTSALAETEFENYMAELLSVLLAARVITPEQARARTGVAYTTLAYLLEDRFDNPKSMGDYIENIADGSLPLDKRLAYIIKAILRAVPITVFKELKHAVEVLWAA